MRYIRKQSEVLAEESGLLRTMTPSEVWNSEHDSKRAAQASLSYLGITIDSEFRSVSAFLRSFAESPFGEIRLGGRNARRKGLAFARSRVRPYLHRQALVPAL